MASWYLTVNDTNKNATTFIFDVIDGESPLIVGLDVKRYSKTDNISIPTIISFQSLTDTNVKEVFTYISNDDDQNPRLRIEIAPHRGSSMKMLLSGILKQTEMNLAKNPHRFLHASPEDTISLLKDAGVSSMPLENACQKVHAACKICASTGRPHLKRNISLTYVNEAFYLVIRADFTLA